MMRNWARVVAAGALLAAGIIATPPTANAAPPPGVNVALRITFDGTIPFNPNDDPGFDSDPNNGIVRTLDFVGIAVEYQFNNIPDGETRFVNVETQNGGFSSLPSACGPQSIISADTSTLNCEIVPTDTAGTVGSISHQVLVGAARNGDTFSMTAQAVTDTLSSPADSEAVTISAAPFWDVVVGQENEVFSVDFDNGRPGWLVSFPITVEADLAATGDGRGAEGLVGPIEFDIDFAMNDGNNQPYTVELYDGQEVSFDSLDVAPCSANEPDYFKAPKRNLASSGSLGNINSTSESGEWTCSQAAAGATIRMTIANADFSPNRFPPGTLAIGAYLPRKIMLSGYVTAMVFKDGQISESLPNGGVLPIDVTISDFDPNGLSGGSNFGGGFENTSNNGGTANVSTFPPGFWDSYYINNTHYLDPIGAHPGYPNAGADVIFFDLRPAFLNPAQPLHYPTQSQSDHAGDGVVFPGATWGYQHGYSGREGAVGPNIMCFAFDPATSTVVNAPAPAVWSVNTTPGDFFGTNVGAPSFLAEPGLPVQVLNSSDSRDWGVGPTDSGTADTPTIEYGTAVAPLDGSPITCEDTDAVAWLDDPSSFDDGTGRYPTLTTIRAFWPGGTPAGELARVTVTLEADAGLPAGTLIPAQSAWALYDGTWTGSAADWNNSDYDVTNHTNVNYGDRMIVGDRTMLVSKEIVSTVTEALQPGDEVTFRLTGRIDGSPADMTLVDILPEGMSILSSTIPPSSVTPAGNPGDPDMYQWMFPDTNGTEIVEYTAVVDSDAPDGATLLNILIGSATQNGQIALNQPNSSLQSFQRILLQTSSHEIDLWKSTPQDERYLDTNLPFQLNIANVATEPLTNVTVIDVLPWNGDDRDSSFTGGYTLLTPAILDDVASGALLSATNAAPSTIDADPATNANTWCEPSDFGDAGCPTSWADTTALRVTASEMLPGEQITADIVLDLTGSVPGDTYANDWAGRSSEIPFLARSGVVNTSVVGNSLNVSLVCGADGATMPALPFTATDGTAVLAGSTNDTTLANLLPGTWTVTVDMSSLEIGETGRVVEVAMEAGVDHTEAVTVSACGTATPTTMPTTTTSTMPDTASGAAGAGSNPSVADTTTTTDGPPPDRLARTGSESGTTLRIALLLLLTGTALLARQTRRRSLH